MRISDWSSDVCSSDLSLAYMLGGRAAEEMVFHDPTSGAGNDIEKATGLARAMVTQYGMTERLGAVKLGEANSEPFMGRDMGHARDYSEQTAAAVDEEVKKLRSEEHTSELQSLMRISYAVFCLKKKNSQKHNN